MIITPSQKTTTVFAVVMDAADVNDLVASALRARIGVADYPGVTVGITLAPASDGSIGGTASVVVETTQLAPDAASPAGNGLPDSGNVLPAETPVMQPDPSVPPVPPAVPSFVPGFAIQPPAVQPAA